MIEIIPATLENITPIAEIGSRTFDEAFGYLFTDKEELHKYLNSEFSIQNVSAGINSQSHYYWLATWSGQPAAYAKLIMPPADALKKDAELERIYTLDTFTGKGIGSGLLDAIKNFGVKAQLQNIYLHVWDHNHAARRLYERHGFELVNTQEKIFARQSFNFNVMNCNLAALAPIHLSGDN